MDIAHTRSTHFTARSVAWLKDRAGGWLADDEGIALQTVLIIAGLVTTAVIIGAVLINAANSSGDGIEGQVDTIEAKLVAVASDAIADITT